MQCVITSTIPENAENPKKSRRFLFNLIVMKSKSTMFLLWLFGGMFGLHRFYVGKTMSGLLFAFTGGFCVLGWALDFFKLGAMVDEYNAKFGGNNIGNVNNNTNTNANNNANNIVINLTAPTTQPQQPMQNQQNQTPQQNQQ